MKKKRFKKLLMSKGISRNKVNNYVRIFGLSHNRKTYKNFLQRALLANVFSELGAKDNDEKVKAALFGNMLLNIDGEFSFLP